jgi:hypothetical protein
VGFPEVRHPCSHPTNNLSKGGSIEAYSGILFSMEIRNYKPEDYEAISALYKDSSTYGGQFDEARDTSERLQKLV